MDLHLRMQDPLIWNWMRADAQAYPGRWFKAVERELFCCFCFENTDSLDLCT